MKRLSILLYILSSAIATQAQDGSALRKNIANLSATSFGGRGYVGNSRDKAARFLIRNFTEIGLSSFDSLKDYTQVYVFPVNTFPNRMLLKLGKHELKPGVDFLIDAASPSFQSVSKTKIERINMDKFEDLIEWQKQRNKMSALDVYQLKHVDSFCKRLHTSKADFVAHLPKACFVIPQNQKLIWTVATNQIPATVFYVADTSLPKGRKVEVNVQSKLETKAISKNIIGYIPGMQVSDSFIVFTAHYDHLGKMGAHTVFPGASDNASGTAFMLELAKYFKAHPQKYPVAFIAFSGEEAGLLGSQYYVQHPVFPLSQIKCLINIDLMGDASEGITMVNAVAQKSAFEQLQAINAQKSYLPKILSRDNAPNSDHYPFTQANVPAFFIYANGGPGYYHDVFDKAQTLSLNNVPQVFQLLTDYVTSLSFKP